MNNIIDVWNFMVSKYGVEKSEEIRDSYEEDYGLNGLDYLWSINSEDELNEVLKGYEN